MIISVISRRIWPLFHLDNLRTPNIPRAIVLKLGLITKQIPRYICFYTFFSGHPKEIQESKAPNTICLVI